MSAMGGKRTLLIDEVVECCCFAAGAHDGGNMLRGASAGLFLALAVVACAPAQRIEKPMLPATDPLAQVPALLDEALVPGAQVALIEEGQIDVQAYGVANAETRKQVTETTVFEAASLGKAVFAYGVLKLANAGKIDLDAPIGTYLSDLSAPLAALTARQLLSHQAGLPNDSNGGEFATPIEPGQRFSYSGEGIRLLQRVVEQITGKPLQEYMAGAVFVPLGMTSSSYVWRSDYEQRKAFGHGFTGNVAGRNRIPDARAASSLETTASDYARLLIALAKGEGLTPAIAAEAIRPQVWVEEGCIVCIGKPRTPLSESIAWGLGIGLAPTPAGQVLWHFGDNGTMQGYAAITGNSRRGIVILTNSINGHSIARKVAADYLGFDAPGYAWAGTYTPYTDPQRQLLSKIVHGIAADPAGLARSDVRAVAQRLLEGERPAEAAALLRKLPGEHTAAEHVLLARAYRGSGDLPAAQSEVNVALGLEPSSKDAREVAERIAMDRRVVPIDTLKSYVGHYSTPYGVLEIALTGSRLIARLPDQQPSQMLPMSHTRFLMERMGVPIEFVRGSDGRVTHAIVAAGGDIRLPRLD